MHGGGLGNEKTGTARGSPKSPWSFPGTLESRVGSRRRREDCGIQQRPPCPPWRRSGSRDPRRSRCLCAQALVPPLLASPSLTACFPVGGLVLPAFPMGWVTGGGARRGRGRPRELSAQIQELPDSFQAVVVRPKSGPPLSASQGCSRGGLGVRLRGVGEGVGGNGACPQRACVLDRALCACSTGTGPSARSDRRSEGTHARFPSEPTRPNRSRGRYPRNESKLRLSSTPSASQGGR
ncbi:hypothetical protein P7K49_011983, partial [Saguinus oedipus]